jgi:hypothetical protein
MKMHLFFEQSYTYLSGKLRCSTYATGFSNSPTSAGCKFLVFGCGSGTQSCRCRRAQGKKDFRLQRGKVIAHQKAVHGDGTMPRIFFTGRS